MTGLSAWHRIARHRPRPSQVNALPAPLCCRVPGFSPLTPKSLRDRCVNITTAAGETIRIFTGERAPLENSARARSLQRELAILHKAAKAAEPCQCSARGRPATPPTAAELARRVPSWAKASWEKWQRMWERESAERERAKKAIARAEAERDASAGGDDE